MGFDSHREGIQIAGFALVAVLLFLLVASSIMAPFSIAMLTRSMILANQAQKSELDLLAEGLVNVLATRLSDRGAHIGIKLSDEPVACTAGAWRVFARVQGHSGLIDLNVADHNLLALGFDSLGLDKNAAEQLAIAVAYFRGGASVFAAPAKQNVQVTGGYKFAPFESVSELADFSGLEGIPVRGLYRTFTVHSRVGTVDAAQAVEPLADLLAAERRARSAGGRQRDNAAFTIEVTVSRHGRRIVGSAGYIYERRQGLQAVLLRAAPVPGGSLAAAPATDIGSCVTLLGAAIVQVLAA